MEIRVYDPADRAKEKEASRAEDRRAVDSGEKSPEQLRRENARFAFPGVKLDLRAMSSRV